MTVREALAQALREVGKRHGPEEVPPSVVLWPDKGSQWAAAIPKLRADMPALLTLGPYDAVSKTGPAIWLRCMVARTLEEADWPEDETPVVYMPGVSRADLRNAEDCPHSLQPLVWLQYVGTVWSHQRGRDWTIAAFLASLGLEVAQDEDTKEAIRERLPRLLDAVVDDLRLLGRLDAVKVRDLGADWPSELLRWMERPDERSEDWETFKVACKSRFAFDPESDGELVAADRLAEGKGEWAAVWSRFAHAPKRYPRTGELLHRVTPPDLFPARREGYAVLNQQAEADLRAALGAAAKKDASAARQRIIELEEEHGMRRAWVWAELGEAPLACALEPLATCAHSTSTALSAATLEELIGRYADWGWKADLAALKSYASVEAARDLKLVRDLLQVIYKPWLEASAVAFAELCSKTPLHTLWKPVSAPTPGECILFADGLRYDVATVLRANLECRGLDVSFGQAVCGLPAVTATAKAAVSPVTDLLSGSETGTDFLPVLKANGKLLTSDAFRHLLTDAGIQVLNVGELGDADGMAWAEAGALDRLGHDEGVRLAKRIEEEVRLLAERVEALLSSGWKKVRIVTDHGWLWLPGGLPKADLPDYLAETRWGRCAALKPTSTSSLQTIPWHYEPTVLVAVPPGISCFVGSMEYAHGGLSLQECVVPELEVTERRAPHLVTIDSVVWERLRCKVSVTGGEGHVVDLRTRPADRTTSVAFEAKQLDTEGKATLFVGDDHEGLAVSLVVLGPDGRVVTKIATTVGENP